MSDMMNKKRNRILAFVMTVMMLVSLLPGYQTETMAATSNDTGTIFKVTVKSSGDEAKPIAEASVTLKSEINGGKSWSSTTDESGVASFSDFSEDVKAGTVTGNIQYTVSAEGYNTSSGEFSLDTSNDSGLEVSLDPTESVVGKTFSVTVTVENATVKLNEEEKKNVTVNEGDTVSVEIIPDSNYYIKELTVDGTQKNVEHGKSYTETITVDKDIDIKAETQLEYTVTVNKNEGGTVTVNENALNDSDKISIDSGLDVMVQVNANEGYQIESIKIDGVDETLSGNKTYNKKIEAISKNITITVQFIRVYTVNIQYAGNGEIKVDEEKIVSGGSFVFKENKDTSDKITFEAIPDTHYRVSQVKINEVDEKISGENDLQFKKELDKTQNYDIEVTFALNLYSVTAEKTEHGKIEISNAEVEYGKSTEVVIIPDEGYTVDTIPKDTELKKTGDKIYFVVSDLAEDVTIEVTFKEKAKASPADVEIDSSAALRQEKTVSSSLYVIKSSSEIKFSTEKSGLRIYDADGVLFDGDEKTQLISISETKDLGRIQLYYQADDELYADWHDLDLGIIRVVADTTNPTLDITSTAKPNEFGYVNSDVTLNVSAKDLDDYSGIQSITYWIIRNSEAEGEGTLLYEYDEDGGDILNNKDCTIEISARDYNSEDVRVKIVVVDRAGNECTHYESLHINSTVPVITLGLDGTKNLNALDGYFNSDRELTIIVTDRQDTFNPDAVAAGLNITENGQKISVKSEDIIWTGTADNHVGKYKFTRDAKYEWNISYINKAGVSNNGVTLMNEDDGTFYNFTIDKTAPENLTVTYDQSVPEVFLEAVTFGFYKASTRVTISASDTTSGVEQFEYSYKVQDGASEKNEGKEKIIVNEKDSSFTLEKGVASVSFEISAQFRGNVSFSVTDKAGHTTAYTDSKVIVVDSIAPGITVSYDNNNSYNDNYYNADRIVTIKIDEANFFGESEYDFIPGTEEPYLAIKVGKTLNNGTYSESFMEPEFIKDGDIYTAEVSFTENADYTFDIKYTDRSGNVFDSYPQDKFTIDKIKPVVKVTYDNNTAENGKYFNKDRKAIISITEHNFDVSTVMGIKLDGVVADSYISYLTNIENWKQEGDTYIAELLLSDEGDYILKPECKDLANNFSEEADYGGSVAPVDFVIDKTAPVQSSMKITYRPTYVGTVLETLTFGFYQAPVTVAIEAEDATSTIDYFTYSYKVQAGASTVNIGQENAVIRSNAKTFSADGGKAVATFEIPAQFRGFVSFKATDMAGNTEDMEDTNAVVVDSIAPGITVTWDNNDVRNGNYYKADRTATISINEANFFEDDLTDLVPGTEEEYLVITVGKTPLDGSPSVVTKVKPEFTKNGDIYTATVKFNENAEYTFDIKYTDRSGNVYDTYEMDDFIINKVAPRLSISYDNMDVKNETYYNDDRVATITIVESTFRANDIKFDVTATDVTGKAVDLSAKAYENYLQNQQNWVRTGTNVWTSQVVFDIEGSYSLRLEYENLTGVAQEKVIEDAFCIDKHIPENMKISYSPDFIGTILETLTFGFYKSPVEVTIEATDEYAGVDYFVYSYDVEADVSSVNSSKSDVTIKRESITVSGNKYTAKFTIPAQFRGNVSFSAIDKAGNTAYLYDERVVVVDNIAPGVSVRYDNNAAHYEKYYDNDRTAVITINEANFYGTSGWSYADLYDFVPGTEEEYLLITVEKTLDDGTYTKTKVRPEFTKNGDIYTAEVNFTENADYTFDIKYTDRSGNVYDAYAKDEFTIDKIQPIIKVSYDNNSSKNGDQFNKDREATVVITEHNFNAADVAAKIMASGTEMKQYADSLSNPANWSSNGDVHTAKIMFSTEAHYTFDISYKDMAGNSNMTVDYGESIAPSKFTLDKTAPTNLTIKIGNRSVLGTNSIAFNTFYDTKVTVNLSADCNISGLQSLKYQKVSEASQYLVNGNWTEYNSNTGIPVSPSEKFIIYFRAEDRAGNVTIVNSTGIVVDNQMPTGEISAPQIDILPAAPNANGIYNGNVSVNLKVIDPGYLGGNSSKEGHYSGLNKISYRIYTTDTDASQEDVLMNLENKTDGAAYDEDNLIHSWTGKIVVDAAKFNSNNTFVEVVATDNAGNTRITTTKPGTFKIDITKPVIGVEYDNNAADSNSYFKENRTATITVTERNFNPDDVVVTITNTDGVIPTVSAWKQTSVGTGNSDNATWSATILYNADGDYTFDVTCTDLADNPLGGNVNYGNSVSPNEFTIDKTIPVIGVLYDNNNADVDNTNFYKEARKATITITEHNFNEDRIKITITATDDGKSTDIPTVDHWVTNGDVHTATILYDKDALYSFDIEFNDMAGNASADFEAQNFYIDKTNPTLEITGIEDKSANSGEVIPVVTYSDTNYDANRITITLSGANRGIIESFEGEYEEIHNGQIFTFENFEETKDVDDIYTLTVKITDKAGNTTTQTKIFSVNRFGSTYEISDSAKKLNGTYVQAPVDIVLTETNADELSDITVTIFKNNETITLIRDQDYSVKVVGGNGSWYQYTYTIFAENFTDDGVYRIAVHSKDSAGNIAENSLDTKNMEISFGIDKTAPTLVVTNLESNVTYALEKLSAILSANDNLMLDKIVVYLDDYDNIYKQWGSTDIASILANGGEFDFDILGDSTDAHRVMIVCTDVAGNETVEEITGFYVTTNVWVRYYNNKPLFFGSIGGVILLIALIVVLIVVKRRKSEKK